MPQTIASANDAGTRARLAGPGVRAFFRITDAWGLTDQQRLALLGQSVVRSTLLAWKEQPPRTLSVDQIERLSYVVGIHEGLERVFRHAPEMGRRWLGLARAEHPFHGKSALSYMLEGSMLQLAAVRQYIDSVSGGPPSRQDYAAPAREA